ALIAQSYQNMEADGVFYQMPLSSDGVPLPPQSVNVFNPSYNKDKFENTAWTVHGRFGVLRAVYTGSYLDRNVDQVGDYTNYARGVYADYYQCHGADPSAGLQATCFSPSSTWRERERNTHHSEEVRLRTPDPWRVRAILGAFYEDFEIQDQTQWYFKTLPACTTSLAADCLTDVAPVPGASTGGAPLPNDNTAFFEDIQRGYRQYAVFGSADVDLIPKVLTATAGTRFHDFENTEAGQSVSGFGCFQAGPAPCASETATNMDAEHLRSVDSGFTSRANLTWHLGTDALLYLTWSQGFRPGGFNQASTCHALGTAVDNFCTPLRYTSDRLTNEEFGWKMQGFDHRIQWNGALYQENWSNVQVDFFDPGQLGNLLFFTNGPDYRVRGLETTLRARLARGLTLDAAASWNRSRQTNSPFLIANDPALLRNPATAAQFGRPITAFRNPYGPVGSPAANAPALQVSVRLRYGFTLDGYRAFLQASGMHTAGSFTQAGSNPSLAAAGAINTTFLRFEDPAYSLIDASAGIDRDAWRAEIYVHNLTDEIASIFTSTAQFIESQTITRPRVVGVEFGYRF
ncbi:MAG: TonB-dependent receptor, partial [Gammaproteobacteria bacterium]|nr:TonB-dependent receptor [Gammaproteobacteria bacterium]